MVDAIARRLNTDAIIAYDGQLDDIDVRQIREKLGMTQLEFASSFGVSLSSVRNWEQGRFHPDLAMRNYLAVIRFAPKTVLRALAADDLAQARKC